MSNLRARTYGYGGNVIEDPEYLVSLDYLDSNNDTLSIYRINSNSFPELIDQVTVDDGICAIGHYYYPIVTRRVDDTIFLGSHFNPVNSVVNFLNVGDKYDVSTHKSIGYTSYNYSSSVLMYKIGSSSPIYLNGVFYDSSGLKCYGIQVKYSSEIPPEIVGIKLLEFSDLGNGMYEVLSVKDMSYLGSDMIKIYGFSTRISHIIGDYYVIGGSYGTLIFNISDLSSIKLDSRYSSYGWDLQCGLV